LPIGANDWLGLICTIAARTVFRRGRHPYWQFRIAPDGTELRRKMSFWNTSSSLADIETLDANVAHLWQ
jgi:hypothetical protein